MRDPGTSRTRPCAPPGIERVGPALLVTLVNPLGPAVFSRVPPDSNPFHAVSHHDAPARGLRTLDSAIPPADRPTPSPRPGESAERVAPGYSTLQSPPADRPTPSPRPGESAERVAPRYSTLRSSPGDRLVPSPPLGPADPEAGMQPQPVEKTLETRLPDGEPNYACEAAMACSRSQTISSTSSMPTEIRTRSLLTPASSCCSSVNC